MQMSAITVDGHTVNNFPRTLDISDTIRSRLVKVLSNNLIVETARHDAVKEPDWR